MLACGRRHRRLGRAHRRDLESRDGAGAGPQAERDRAGLRAPAAAINGTPSGRNPWPWIRLDTPLADAAEAFLADRRIAPFTTPGHKRAPHLADDFLRHDLPLSSGADDLHARGGYLAAAEGLAAELWGADLCRFCLNGSTQGNQALALAAARPGQRAIVSRNLHKSVFAGLVLAGLEPVWIRPEIDRRTGLAHGIRTEALAAALAVAPDAQAVVLVEPSFVGVVSDVAALASLSHEAGLPLIVDQAWGAHFGFHPGLPAHSLALGADAMVVSAHKTLTSFTQGAYLFARGGRLDLARVSEAFDLLHTTSPSAAILASLDRARRLMATRGEELLARTLELAAGFRERMAGVEGPHRRRLRRLDEARPGACCDRG